MKVDFTRRDFVGKVLPGVVGAAAFLNNPLASAFGAGVTRKAARLGVIGVGGRGTGLLQILLTFPEVQVNAICDLDPKHIERAQTLVRNAKGNTPTGYSNGPTDYKKLLRRDDIDAVLIATPIQWHVPMSVDAMKAGKDVGCEVPAGDTLRELLDLVEAKEKTGRHYMLLENYIYTRDRLMVYNMIQQNVFGEPYYAECGYIHNCKSLFFNSDGSLAWRGERARDNYEHSYPTHSLGPVSKWFGINDGDRMEYMTTMMTKPRSIHEYAVKRFGANSPQAKINFKRGDFYTTTINTAQGKVIRLDYDYISNRPPEFYYLLQGTEGIYNSRHGAYANSETEAYKSMDSFRDKYEHSYWKQAGDTANKTGHGGGDYFVLKDFVGMVIQDREPWVDVYDAAVWSSIGHCSKLSLDSGSAAVEMPDFTGGKWKESNWRKGNMKPEIS